MPVRDALIGPAWRWLFLNCRMSQCSIRTTLPFHTTFLPFWFVKRISSFFKKKSHFLSHRRRFFLKQVLSYSYACRFLLSNAFCAGFLQKSWQDHVQIKACWPSLLYMSWLYILYTVISGRPWLRALTWYASFSHPSLLLVVSFLLQIIFVFVFCSWK